MARWRTFASASEPSETVSERFPANEPPCGEGAAFLVQVFAGPAASEQRE
jgi:hypothetical protein